jgi:hypothetical protein
MHLMWVMQAHHIDTDTPQKQGRMGPRLHRARHPCHQN